MKEKEVQTKELYPFVSDAIKKMDISLENIQWAHKIITNNTAGYLDDINKIQKYVEDIIDNACSVFREKITKELSLDDLLLYAQVAKTSQDFDNNKKRTSFFDKKIQDITIKDIDLTIYDYYQKSRHEEMKEVREKELEVKKEDSEAYYKMVRERKKKADERFRKNGHRRY